MMMFRLSACDAARCVAAAAPAFFNVVVII